MIKKNIFSFFFFFSAALLFVLVKWEPQSTCSLDWCCRNVDY